MSGEQEPSELVGSVSDEALARRAKQDRAAFGVLYDRYAHRVFGYCFRRLQTREAAEDATAQTFARALEALPRYRDDAPSFAAWLFTIARRIVVDEHRVRGRAPTSLFLLAPLHDAHSGPEDAAIAADALRELNAMLAQLSPDQRRVVELRLAGLDDREIAFVLGCSHGAVRVAQHRAVKRLRALFGGGERDVVNG